MPSPTKSGRDRAAKRVQHSGGGGSAAEAATNTKESTSWQLRGPVAAVVGVVAVVVGCVCWWPGPQPAPREAPRAPEVAEQEGQREPVVYSYRVVQKYAHDPRAFTQGLLWLNGSFYESTGLHGQSEVREVSLEGKVLQRVAIGPKDFGEGLAYHGGDLWQLLWLSSTGYRFTLVNNATPGKRIKKRRRPFRTPLADGWGLASDGESLLLTDSGPEVFFLDPDNLTIRRSIKVRDAGRLVEMVNELEVVDGELWANVYGTECIARVDLATGEVRSWLVLEGLLDRQQANAAAAKRGLSPPDVLNGIAWDAEGRRLFVTGKLWPSLFHIEVVPATAGLSLEHARQRCIPRENIFRRR